MHVGYARTSTLDQSPGLEAQRTELEIAGCEKLYIEQVSSVDVKAREKLAEALDYIREGDTLVVTKLDRLARSVAHLLEINDQIEAKGAHVRILSMDIDTRTANGRLMLTILGGVAEFEREIMLERQREGIAKANEIMALKSEGFGPAEIARRLMIGRASVYRILNDRKADERTSSDKTEAVAALEQQETR